MDGKSKTDRNKRLEKLKKLRSAKTHSNSFVLSNVSILKKSNIELAKKLSLCQADLLSYQEQYHVTWQQNVCLTLELKEYKRKLDDVEQMLEHKNELMKKIKYNSDIISNLLLSESFEGNSVVHSTNNVGTVPAILNKKPERIPVNSADPSADDPPENVEEKILDSAKQAPPGRMFQCNKPKPSKIMQACSLKMVEEVADASMNLPIVSTTEEENNKINEQPELKNEKPPENASHSHNCTRDIDSIPMELNASQEDVKKNEDDYEALNSTTQALKLLPKHKRKRRKTLRKCDNNDDINNSTININSLGLDKENFTSQKTIIENRRTLNLNNKPSGKAGGKKSVSFRQSTSSPLRLYLDPNDTISSEMHSDVEDLSLIEEPNKIPQCNDSPSPTRGFLTERLTKNRAQSYDNTVDGNSVKNRTQALIENPAKKRAQSYDNNVTTNENQENSRRPRRGKAVSYKEPSLNKKMRRLK